MGDRPRCFGDDSLTRPTRRKPAMCQDGTRPAHASCVRTGVMGFIWVLRVVETLSRGDRLHHPDDLGLPPRSRWRQAREACLRIAEFELLTHKEGGGWEPGVEGQCQTRVT